ncbi:MAG: DUF4249 domain-containing protein [Bacteroidia bacterium]|jgi:hypothetical protein|nr:DUF4249 domain-containing protein [Bacteroidia bacterium]
MKKQIFNSILLSAVVIFTSCEDVVQVELDAGSKLYVIDAFITDQNQPQSIVITQSDNYFSNQQAPVVSGAQVLLTDITNNAQYTFTYSGNGRYVYDAATLPPIGAINHAFELNVNIDGFNYTAMATQKRTAVIDSISAVFNDGTGGFGSGEPFYVCALWARDKVDQNADYYWIKTFRNDTLFGGPGDLNTSIDGTNGEVFDPNADTLDFTPPGIFLGFNSYQKNDVCKVEIHSISRECYNFLNQAVAQIQNGGLFATTPENVRTNIVTPSGTPTKAIGWFNMASVVSKSKVVQ